MLRTAPAMPVPRPRSDTLEFFAAVHAVVRAIPRGHVATYGQVAALAGWPRRARMVGAALQQASRQTPLPWHRVINARGELSLDGQEAQTQRERLVAEGIVFRANGRIDLNKYGI